MKLAERLRNATMGRNAVAVATLLTAATVPVSVAYAQTPAATLSVITPKSGERLGTNRFNLDVRFKSLTNSPIVTAELWVDGVRWVRRDLDSPRRASLLSFLVDGSTLPAGAHTIVVKVLNAEGNVSTAKVSVVAGSDDATGDTAYGGPDVRFVTPGNGKKVVGTVELIVDAQTKNGTKPYVSFFVDNKFKTLKNFPPYTFAWDTTNETNGVHTVTASGYLDSTNATTTRTITVVVNNPGGFTKRVSEIPDLSAPRKTTATKPLTIPLPAATVAAPTGEATLAEATPTLAAADTLGLVKSAPVRVATTVAPRLSVPTLPTFAAAKTAPLVVAPQIVRNNVSSDATPHGVAEPISAASEAIDLSAATFAGLADVEAVAPKVSLAAPRLSRPAVTVATVIPQTGVVLPKRTSVAAPVAVIAKPKLVRRVMAKPLQVAFDGERIAFDVAPRVDAGMPVAPFRQIFEHTGGKVSWTNSTKTMRAVNSDREIVIGIGKSSAIVNGEAVSMDRSAALTRGRTVVPLNFVGKALDVNVKYDPATGRLTITSKN